MNQYFPSNGTEGVFFFERHCEQCYKYGTCTILRCIITGVQPKQWNIDENGKPICTSFNSERPIKAKENNQPKLF